MHEVHTTCFVSVLWCSKNTRMSDCIRLRFAICKPTSFSECFHCARFFRDISLTAQTLMSIVFTENMHNIRAVMEKEDQSARHVTCHDEAVSLEWTHTACLSTGVSKFQQINKEHACFFTSDVGYIANAVRAVWPNKISISSLPLCFRSVFSLLWLIQWDTKIILWQSQFDLNWHVCAVPLAPCKSTWL